MATIILELQSENYHFYNEKKNMDGDSGFDLYCLGTVVVPPKSIGFKLDLGIKVEIVDVYRCPKPYMLVPRSSMGAKTPLRLSNSIGIIDRFYRGNLIALLDNIGDEPYTISEGDRLLQIVPFDGEGIANIEFGNVSKTNRGEAGLGSTGK